MLTVCPDEPDCWIYRVRAGDTLTGIANFFGVPLARILDMNEGLQPRLLRVGQQIRIPTPTR